MRWFHRLSVTAKAMCKALAILYPILFITGFVISVYLYPFEKPLAFAIGLLAGIALSIIKVVLLEKSLTKSLDMEGKVARNYTNLQMIARYFLTIAILVLAVFYRNIIGIFGLIAGIIALQPAAYIAAWHVRKQQLDTPIQKTEE